MNETLNDLRVAATDKTLDALLAIVTDKKVSATNRIEAAKVIDSMLTSLSIESIKSGETHVHEKLTNKLGKSLEKLKGHDD